jgi:hypothetical protein
MNKQTRNEYVNYRLNRADETLKDALILADNKRWNAVINRLYYAAFYAVIAILVSEDIETTSHDGARNQFSLHFIKSGIFEKEEGKLFSRLFDYRQKGDYGDMFDFNEEVVKPLIPKVENFISVIKKRINTKNGAHNQFLNHQ